MARRDEALFAVYAFTGIRRSEALVPRIRDYDASTKRLAFPLVKGGREGSRHIARRLARIFGSSAESVGEHATNTGTAAR